MHFWVKEFKFVQMKGNVVFQGEIIMKYQKDTAEIKKSSSPKPTGQFKPNLTQSILGLREFESL